MYENEKQAIESLINFKPNLFKAQQHIYETYNVDSYYDDEENILVLLTKGINESLSVAKAKEYIDNEIGENFVTVMFKSEQ
jgi:hypothetical protein